MKKKMSLEVTLEEIGTGLSILRMSKGFDTVSNFAIAFDLPPNQYWKIENGKANITIKTLLRLLEIHNVTVEEFFCHLKAAR
jgi:transcriptional regulator with XRE-family HTH domain